MLDPSQPPSVYLMAAVAAATALASSAALYAYSVFVPRCQFWAPVIRSIPQRDAVALTFDDGPHPSFTPQILDLLASHQIHATFFVIGRNAQAHPDLIRRIHNEGHTLGNHTLDHDHFGVNRKYPYWLHQLSETQKIISDIIGHPPFLFRPPMGFKTRHLARAAKELRLPIIGWSVRAHDAKPKPTPVDLLACRLIKRTAGHDILLLHDGLEPARTGATQQPTVDALPPLLAHLQQKNLRPLSLLEALLDPDNSKSNPVASVRPL